MNVLSVDEAIAEIRAGRPLVVVDDPHRENEGDVIFAAACVTAANINFMVTHARGLVCAPMMAARLAELDLPLMVEHNTTPTGTAFTVPVDAREGTTTGIAAFERANTIRVLIDPATRPDDLLRPGHIFPLKAADGGVLVRPGHTEAAVDLARLAGHVPAGVVCEILADDGRMARGPELAAFARTHGLGVLAIADLIRWREAHDADGLIGALATSTSTSASTGGRPGLTLLGSSRSNAALSSTTQVTSTSGVGTAAAAVTA
ncbi:MAG: 3,4-dihydroxy-2-butanone-4-phosphate synthase [Ardenticatenales bacterium]